MLSLVFVVIVIVATVWSVARGEGGGQVRSQPEASGDGGTEEHPGAWAEREKGPPSAGQGLDALKARLSEMPTDSLQTMLDMGATLKPGAEELILQELERRS